MILPPRTVSKRAKMSSKSPLDRSWAALGPSLATLGSLLVGLRVFLAALGALEPPLEALLARLGGSLGLLDAPGGRPRSAKGVDFQRGAQLASAQARGPLPVYMYICMYVHAHMDLPTQQHIKVPIWGKWDRKHPYMNDSHSTHTRASKPILTQKHVFNRASYKCVPKAYVLYFNV